MLYTSTRDNSIRVTAAQAIAQGISVKKADFLFLLNFLILILTKFLQ